MLCLSEKFHILFSKERLLNQRNEIKTNLGIMKFNLLKEMVYRNQPVNLLRKMVLMS